MIPETNARIQVDRKLSELGYVGGLLEINKGLSCMEELNKSTLENSCTFSGFLCH